MQIHSALHSHSCRGRNQLCGFNHLLPKRSLKCCVSASFQNSFSKGFYRELLMCQGTAGAITSAGMFYPDTFKISQTKQVNFVQRFGYIKKKKKEFAERKKTKALPPLESQVATQRSAWQMVSGRRRRNPRAPKLSCYFNSGFLLIPCHSVSGCRWRGDTERRHSPVSQTKNIWMLKWTLLQPHIHVPLPHLPTSSIRPSHTCVRGEMWLLLWSHFSFFWRLFSH